MMEYSSTFLILGLETLSICTRRSEVQEYFNLTNFHPLMCIHFVFEVYFAAYCSVKCGTKIALNYRF